MTKDIKHWHSKVVGVTHKNADGTKRQDIIKGLRIGEGLLFPRETDNPKEPLAMAVLTQDRHQIGYLQADLAHEMASKFEHGRQFTGLVTNLTGGTEDKTTRGVSIALIEFDPALKPEDIQHCSPSA